VQASLVITSVLPVNGTPLITGLLKQLVPLALTACTKVPSVDTSLTEEMSIAVPQVITAAWDPPANVTHKTFNINSTLTTIKDLLAYLIVFVVDIIDSYVF
jgi:hypothetical protein